MLEFKNYLPLGGHVQERTHISKLLYFGQKNSIMHQEVHRRKTGRDSEAAAAHSKSSPSIGSQASLQSPTGRSIPSMVYLCIHIGGEWEWSLLSIVASLNIFRKPSIASASSILGSINSQMWPSVFSLAQNTCNKYNSDAKREDFSPHQMPWEWGEMHGAGTATSYWSFFVCVKETHLLWGNLSGWAVTSLQLPMPLLMHYQSVIS